MRATPTIPSWIRDFRHGGYTNVFEFLPEASRLYGTETLFGDWDAQILFLAKDAAPTQVIKDLAAREGTGAWRHAEKSRGDPGGWLTNKRLKKLADEYVPGPKLYGSATANMLYDDPSWSRSLPGFWRDPLHDYLIQVLQWVITSMSNVQVIACLGREAWYLTTKAIGAPHAATQWLDYRDNNRRLEGTIGGKAITVTPHYHPAARISDQLALSGWSALRESLERLPNNSAET